MKLSLNTDFTALPRAGAHAHKGETAGAPVIGRAVLAHDERHLRRRVLTLEDGAKVLVDLLEPAHLEDGDVLVLDDGAGSVEIAAAEEEVYAVEAHDAVHLAELAWHIGNRHLAAGIEAGRIVILRDQVIRAMLEGLGAHVTETVEPFRPVHGAYSGHGHGHAHPAPEADRFGRMPGDPHYGHNHA